MAKSKFEVFPIKDKFVVRKTTKYGLFFKDVTFLDQTYTKDSNVRSLNHMEWNTPSSVMTYCLIGTKQEAEVIKQYAEQYYELIEKARK